PHVTEGGCKSPYTNFKQRMIVIVGLYSAPTENALVLSVDEKTQIQALAVHTGEITARQVDRNNSDNFLKFLKHLDRKYRNVQLHLIMDNLSVHKNKKINKWLAGKRKFHVYLTPTYSSWLNQIEIWFSILTRKILKDGVWHSKEQLTGQLMSYIKTYNEEKAHPFEWSYGKEYLTD